MEEDIKLSNYAFKKYQIDKRDNLPNQILDYIEKRITVNKELISQLIETLDLNISFEEIWNAFQEEKNKEIMYKKEEGVQKLYNNFYVSIYNAPKGNIVIETDDVLETIKCFVYAIQTKNSVTISQLEYEELSLSSFLLVIFCEALNKFNLDRNLIMILPYEECIYANYDAVIKEENGKKFVENKHNNGIYSIYQESDLIINKEIPLQELNVIITETNVWYKRIFEAIKRFFFPKA